MNASGAHVFPPPVKRLGRKVRFAAKEENLRPGLASVRLLR